MDLIGGFFRRTPLERPITTEGAGCFEHITVYCVRPRQSLTPGPQPDTATKYSVQKIV